MSTLIFNSSVYSICSWSGPAGHQGHTHHSLPSGPLGSLCPLHSSHVGAYRKHWVASASHLRERKSTGLSLNFPKSATQPVLLYSMPLPCSVPWPQGQSWSCPLISKTCLGRLAYSWYLPLSLGPNSIHPLLLALMILSFPLACKLLFYPRE